MERNAQGNGSIRRRKDGKWEGRYTLGRDPKTGKQVQKSVYGKTQQEVRKKLAQITADVDNGVFVEPLKLTVGEWLDVFLKGYNRDVKEFTQKSYEVYCERHLRPMLGRIKLTFLTAPMIQSAYNAILEGKTSREPLAPKSLKNCHGVLHKALKIAQKVGYIRTNPTDAVVLPRVEKKPIDPLSDDEIASFLKAIKYHKYENLFKVTLFTGMRQGEALGLTWDCVDFKNHTINIEKQLIREKKKGGRYKFAPLKNDKCHIEQLPDSIFDILVNLHNLPIAKNEMNLVFVNGDGKHLSHCTVSKNFKAIVTGLGLSEQRFHNLRHTFAVLSLQNGDSIKTVQENLGHATAAFTINLKYGHNNSSSQYSI